MDKYEIAVARLNLLKSLEALPVGKSGKPNGHAIRKLWVAASQGLQNGGIARAEAARIVEDVVLPFRR